LRTGKFSRRPACYTAYRVFRRAVRASGTQNGNTPQRGRLPGHQHRQKEHKLINTKSKHQTTDPKKTGRRQGPAGETLALILVGRVRTAIPQAFGAVSAAENRKPYFLLPPTIASHVSQRGGYRLTPSTCEPEWLCPVIDLALQMNENQDKKAFSGDICW
jgi:hypothetical protein